MRPDFRFVFGFLAAFLFAAALWTPMVARGAPIDAWQMDEDWAQAPRSIEFQDDAQGFVFESKDATQPDSDVLVGRFRLDQAQFRLDLVRADRSSTDTLSVAARSVREFHDDDQDGRFDVGEPVLQTWDLSQAQASMGARPQLDGSREVTATYELPGAQGGQLLLRFWIAPGVQALGGMAVPPTATKFDVELRSLELNDTESMVAVELAVDASRPLAVEGSSLAAGAGDFVQRFSWADTAQVDGASSSVGATVAASGSTAQVHLAYPAGDHVTHDPLVSAEHYTATAFEPIITAITKGSAVVYLLGILLVGGVLGVASYRRLRRRA